MAGKVLLVNPPFTRLRGSGQGPYFPLGLGYLAGVLAAEGFEPLIYSAENCRPGEELPKISMREVFDLRSQGHKRFVAALADDGHYVWREFRELLARERPDMVGISALSIQYGPAARMARLVKAWRPEVPVVIGGHHFTYMPADTLNREPAFDVGVLGEGEETLLELCRAYAQGPTPDFSRIPGLAYRTADGVAFTERRKLIENLDALPFPRRDLVAFPESFLPVHFSTIIYGRGCPWHCRFCSSQAFWGNRTRYRSGDNCLAEITQLMERYHYNDFMFWDDAFSVRRDNVTDLCHRVLERGLKFTFHTATRVDLVDDQLIDLMQRAGCVELYLGVESGSPAMLKAIRKDLNLDHLRRAVGLMDRHGVPVSLFFMAGFPRETEDDLGQTFDLIREMRSARVSFNIFDPMPGSPLYDECLELGLVSPDADWANFPLWPDASFTTQMSPERFGVLARRMADYIFSRNESLAAQLRRYLPELRRDPVAFAKKALFKGPRALMRRLGGKA
jgi:radical SAM superfamily enzyme YgiQ (UPF0313 family)